MSFFTRLSSMLSSTGDGNTSDVNNRGDDGSTTSNGSPAEPLKADDHDMTEPL